MSNILEQLDRALASAEPNVLGDRYATVEHDGNVYRAAATTAGSHQSANSWGRVDYKLNGKKIAKGEIG